MISLSMMSIPKTHNRRKKVDWSIILFFANLTLILWFRSESRDDNKMFIERFSGIQKESKDFHGRLSALEEKMRGEK